MSTHPGSRIRRGARAVMLATLGVLALSTAVSAQTDRRGGFSHEPHRKVKCDACHAMNGTEVGAARITPAECTSCHHSPSAGIACTRCHAPAGLTRRYPSTQKLRFSFSPEPVSRTLTFGHAEHGTLQCTTCHQSGPGLATSAASCQGCHEQHHAPHVECRACHDTRTDGAHRNASHLGCGGSQCHQSSPVESHARSRQVCLTCHGQQAQHRPGVSCVECHVLPKPATTGGGRSGR